MQERPTTNQRILNHLTPPERDYLLRLLERLPASADELSVQRLRIALRREIFALPETPENPDSDAI